MCIFQCIFTVSACKVIIDSLKGDHNQFFSVSLTLCAILFFIEFILLASFEKLNNKRQDSPPFSCWVFTGRNWGCLLEPGSLYDQSRTYPLFKIAFSKWPPSMTLSIGSSIDKIGWAYYGWGLQTAGLTFCTSREQLTSNQFKFDKIFWACS